MADLLNIRNLHVHYGGIHALKGVSLRVGEGRMATLIGANGAGKSTLLRAVAGLIRPSDGDVLWRGKSITPLPADRISRMGIALVPEGRRVFANLSVLENLLMGAYVRSDRQEIQRDLEKTLRIFPHLKGRLKQKAGTLSGGEQQMLAVGRALMAKPVMLMLDEPSLGLAPLLVRDVFRVISEIHRQGRTILLIEQNAMAALSVADYGYVLETGRVTLEGEGKNLLENPSVRHHYLGMDGEE
jgi:branched-chain amino acid transport system ATP-binding protein